MSAAPSTARTPTPSAAILNVARVLLLAALAISAYLTWAAFARGTLAGCGPESDCDRVLQSKWSRWFGVPVSVFAVGIDALALWGTFALAGGATPEARRRGGFVAALGALLILGGGIWFIAIQLFALRSICPYCMAAHGTGVTAALLLLFVTGKQSELCIGAFQSAGFVAAAALLVFFAGQYLQKPATGREARVVASSTNAPGTNAPGTNAPRPTFTPDFGPVSAMKRPFKIYEGLFVVDLENIPLIGPASAKHAMVNLFDYTCHHCRLMHPLIEEVQHAFSNDLAVVSLPMPLDPKCNRTIQRTSPDHANACEYARLGLGVWRVDRAKHREFDAWLMRGDQPPPVTNALDHAMHLVGTNALINALKEPWLERHLQFNIGMYELAYRQGHGNMPQFIIGPTVFQGPPTREQLIKMLADNLGLKPPP